jgi:uncharacterized secreted protein with C-terminal beta-propeller domain
MTISKRFWLLALSALTACSSDPSRVPRVRLAMEFFESCDALQSFVHGQLVERDDLYELNRDEDHLDAVPASADFSGGSAPVGTNLQEEGVDEADQVKVTSDRLYIARQKRIEVLSTSTLETLGSIAADPQAEERLYLDGGRLISVASRLGSVKVRVLRRADTPILIHELNFSGQLTTSRLKDGKLYLVMQQALPLVGSEGTPKPKAQPVALVGGQAAGVGCRQVLRPMVEDADLRLVKVHTVDVRASSPSSQSVAVLGGGDVVYMSPEKLYVAKVGYSFPWEQPEPSLLVTELSLQGSSVAPTAVGQVPGQARSQWAFKERDGHLFVTTNLGFSGTGNRTTVLRGDDGLLREVGHSPDFGRGEDVYAVRYVGSTAYVVTFRQTDPLWVIDLGIPSSPSILGELVIPGFSTYLHPVDGARLIGVGVSDSFGPAEISLFDVSNPRAPKKADALELGGYSAALHDHHAFYYDSAASLVGVPYGAAQSGAVLARLDGLTLSEVSRITHSTLRASCAADGDVARIVRPGNEILAISATAISAHPLVNPAKTSRTRRLDTSGGCSFSRQLGYEYAL